ncbi:MAG: universal stress protein [Candidatus Aminicenantes bacterium]|nr:universal stress protein [Candidatus Aminicenantes bacterium]
MFNCILLPLDRSPLAECVLPHAVAIARAFDGRVMLLHVLERPREERQRRAMDPLTWQVRQAEAKTYLHGLDLRLQAAGLQPETHLLEGSAAEQVVGFSDSRAAKLIILSSHGQSGLSDWGMSSGGQKITLRARTSVMIVRAAQEPVGEVTGLRYQRLLVPLDGTQRAESILPAAAALAQAHGAHILLAHIVQKPSLPRRTLPSREDVELVERLIERNRVEATLYLDQLRSRLAGEVATRVLVSDHLSATLHELVEQEGADLVLLSAHGRSRETRGLYGDVISHLIAYGTTPLIILQDRSSIPGEAAAGDSGKP